VVERTTINNGPGGVTIFAPSMATMTNVSSMLGEVWAVKGELSLPATYGACGMQMSIGNIMCPQGYRVIAVMDDMDRRAEMLHISTERVMVNTSWMRNANLDVASQSETATRRLLWTRADIYVQQSALRINGETRVALLASVL
jgi:hypothetical protein